jgi:trigger factor
MTNLTIEKQKGSTLVITGELPWDEFKQYRAKALQKLGEIIAVDGFRKGHIPEDIIVKKAGDSAILEEMANLAFQALYPQILVDEKIDAIGRPSIQITKLANDNPLGFAITTAVFPEIKLPDYKSIASQINKNKEEITVSDDEVLATIEEIRTMKAKQDLFKKMQAGEDGHVHDENCGHDHAPIPNNKDESVEEVQKRLDEKLELPEFNDEFVKSLGEFTSVEEFKVKLKENLAFEKTRKAADKRRIDIIEAIIKETNLELPEIIIESEIDQIMYAMRGDIEQMGMNFEDYLKNLGKSLEDIRLDVRQDAEKRASVQAVVATIAKEEKVTPEEDAIQKEVDVIKKHYPDAAEDSARAYVQTILTNDLVFKMLEAQ